MKRFFLPSLSDRRPKNSAPMTSPIRYHQAMSLTAPADMFSVLCSVRSDPTLAAMVISRPSSIHATPSAITSLVWNFDQGNRSIRAGIRLLMYGLLVVVEDTVAMYAPSNLSSWRGRAVWFPLKRWKGSLSPPPAPATLRGQISIPLPATPLYTPSYSSLHTPHG